MKDYIDGIKQEQNKLKRLSIWIWYNDWFRGIFILCGIWWIIPIMILLHHLGLKEDLVSNLGCLIYIILFGLAFIFNDYSNLRRIGLDEYRNRLL